MRRVIGAVALALGVLLLVVGAVSRSYLYERLATVSLDQSNVVDAKDPSKSTASVSQGENMSALRVWGSETDGQHYDKLTGVTVRSTRQIVGIPGALTPAELDGNIAIWQTGVTSEAVGVGALTYSNEVVTFDRVTGLATGSSRDQRSAGELDKPDKMVDVVHKGLFFKFPFAVEKKTYPWWDGDLSDAAEMKFVREENLFGTDTYVFQQVTPTAERSTRDVPAGVFDQPGSAMVPAKVFYGNVRTLWIEPNTGVIIKGQEQVDKYLQSQFGTVATTKGTIGYTDDTVRKNAETWGSKGRLLGFIHGPLLWIGLVGGLLLIVLGAVLIGRRPAPVAAGAPSGPSRSRRGARSEGDGGIDELGVGSGADRGRHENAGA